ncbi:rho GTPase-activating protein 27 isoform X1 [Ursus arctos]|uniref:rho GTPase-activating protein 27 isoform X1 n=1 Tax=Ursus arctos TaxID=9644 RepID=UPI000E6E04D6|nr:rho GTPase-activating protein 27 isoform X1 [Ursus arctos]XP_057174126.1 rho GTPase-activating protein 27 isoform X1 [Ursus arctos]XP_057174127.1 rho GTPase-activating protein 27 isoform X1 [Ursus arctos]
MAADVEGDVYVLVEHPFEYTGKDGRRVAIQPNERYRLLRRSTEHWWHVRREPGGRPFYLPAQYVRELPALGDPAAASPPPALRQGPAVPEPLAYDYRFVSAPAPAGPEGTPAKPRGRVGSLCGPARHGAATQRSSLAPGLPACLYTRPAALVRPAQSLDDLARAAVAPPAGLLGSAGSFKACSVAGSWVCPRPLARSDSENVYEAIQDVRGPPREERAQQVDDPPEPVYENVERQPSVTSPGAPAAPRPPAWETHTDAGSGRPYYYNPDTGVTTWESPFDAAEGAASPATSPASVGSRESLETDWGQYWDEESRRVFFYNPLTGEAVWEDETEDEPEDELEMQPSLSPLSPRDQRPPTPEMDYPESLTSYPEEDYSPVGSFSEPRSTSPLATPPGWSCQVSPDGQTLYTNHFTQEQWVRLEDQHGKPYFYNPDDASVQWELPQVPVPAPRSIHKSSQDSETPAQASPPEEKIKTLDKAGVLHRTKTVDKGKRLRKKHWSASWTVLEGGVLTFFKDSKASAAGGLRQPPKLSTPEYTVDLRGASLSWAPKDKSSRKNVLELRSRDGSEYLIQHDSEAIISTWYKAIGEGIQELSADLPPEEESESSSADFGSSERLGSWREDEARPGAGAATAESDLSRVRHRLRKFLLKRPTLQSLREKGYIRDQVFGCALAALCERERSSVPRFVQQCIRAVEARGLDIDGLYRISGNLATIQKLRYKVDHDERLDLDDGRWEDVHVITGALKLFFRELPEPLFPFSHFRQFIAAIKLQDQAQRSRCVRDLVRSLPAPNHDTLRLLFQHLCRVIEHGDQNRMSVQSVAIVFGPTLLRPETEETSMPMTMVFQNQVVELILQRCSDIFPPH